jgi:hypothetical protein
MNMLPHQLAELGFVSDAGNGCHRRNGLAFFVGPRWSRFQLAPGHDAAPADRLHADSSRPGLWRWVVADGQPRRLFDLRTEWLAGAGDDEDADDAPEAAPLPVLLGWAEAAARGELPADWQPPARETVEKWFAKSLLSLQAGRCLRQGELVHQPGCLALRFPVHPNLPAPLPEARRQWLRAVLLEAQDNHHLIRLEMTDAAVFATVDLSGAPHFLLPDLTLAALTGLRATVSALAETVELLADADVASAILSGPPDQAPPHEKGQ